MCLLVLLKAAFANFMNVPLFASFGYLVGKTFGVVDKGVYYLRVSYGQFIRCQCAHV